jgi:hypothetical protein
MSTSIIHYGYPQATLPGRHCWRRNCRYHSNTDKIGYPFAFIERQQLLSIMTGRIHRRDCIRTSAHVVSISENAKHVVVTTTSGEAY